MLIPVKCFGCGKVLANKYRYYKREIQKRKCKPKTNSSEIEIEITTVQYLTPGEIHKTHEGDVLDYLGLTKYCCRRHMLTHVDIE